ncbi:hypothetical protein MRB53_038445 [Persea americana]|nr:hypothetical protein MRB53_038445 [Persea americana]
MTLRPIASKDRDTVREAMVYVYSHSTTLYTDLTQASSISTHHTQSSSGGVSFNTARGYSTTPFEKASTTGGSTLDFSRRSSPHSLSSVESSNAYAESKELAQLKAELERAKHTIALMEQQKRGCIENYMPLGLTEAQSAEAGQHFATGTRPSLTGSGSPSRNVSGETSPASLSAASLGNAAMGGTLAAGANAVVDNGASIGHGTVPAPAWALATWSQDDQPMAPQPQRPSQIRIGTGETASNSFFETAARGHTLELSRPPSTFGPSPQSWCSWLPASYSPPVTPAPYSGVNLAPGPAPIPSNSTRHSSFRRSQRIHGISR